MESIFTNELGSIIGTFFGLLIGTMLPYYMIKRKLGEQDVDIFFDKKFLRATAAGAITSIIITGMLYPSILAKIDPNASFWITLTSAAALALATNAVGNWFTQSDVTNIAKQELIQRKANALISRQSNVKQDGISSNSSNQENSSSEKEEGSW